MKSRNRWLKFEKGFIFTALLASQFFFSACSNDAATTRDTKDYSNQSQVEIVERETDLKNSQLTSTKDSLANEEIIEASFVDKGSLGTYIAPETLAKSLNNPVNDFTSTLSTAELAYLNEKLREVYEEGLLQIGVVVVATTENIPTFDYAMTVAKSWKLGSPENNNGLLILMALDDRQIYILTGLDIEDKLTDERVASIINNDMTPHFKNANYVTGLSAGIDSLVDSIKIFH